jgi:hypothetical protein
MKRRAELLRRIAEAEAEWLATESEIERLTADEPLASAGLAGQRGKRSAAALVSRGQ